MDSLPPAALALCPAVLAFFRLRFAPFLLSRHAEEDFWQELGQQFSVPHPLRHQLALYRLCSDELVKDSLRPAPVRVACVDAHKYLWAWQWTDALALEQGFPVDDGPWAGRGDTSSDPPAVEFIYYDDLCWGCGATQRYVVGARRYSALLFGGAALLGAMFNTLPGG